MFGPDVGPLHNAGLAALSGLATGDVSTDQQAGIRTNPKKLVYSSMAINTVLAPTCMGNCYEK
jgi:hypothetical protein